MIIDQSSNLAYDCAFRIWIKYNEVLNYPTIRCKWDLYCQKSVWYHRRFLLWNFWFQDICRILEFLDNHRVCHMSLSNLYLLWLPHANAKWVRETFWASIWNIKGTKGISDSLTTFYHWRWISFTLKSKLFSCLHLLSSMLMHFLRTWIGLNIGSRRCFGNSKILCIRKMLPPKHYNTADRTYQSGIQFHSLLIVFFWRRSVPKLW